MSDIKTDYAFDLEAAQTAGREWGFNCGPAALCALLKMTPDEVRPHLMGFEGKGYTNPSLMADILRGLSVGFRRVFESAREPCPSDIQWPHSGLVRIQWAGPWTEPNRPMVARYRHTHWIATRFPKSDWLNREVFDINAMSCGGWLSWVEWADQLTPWVIEQCQPKATGKWWPTHCWEIEGKADVA
jgi:hypothetical protein